jgi:hypothetical protein
MFVHYKGTVAEFKAANLESTYTNHIVFIKGGEASGNGEAVYTHGQYYANVKDALAALQTKVDGMKYFSKISDGSTTASVASADGTITIKGEDPAIVTLVDKEGVKIGLSDAFKTQVNTTLPNAIDAVEESLGSKEDAADVNGSAFARIANLAEIDVSNSAVIAHIFEVIPQLANELGLEEGFRVVSNCKEFGGQSVFHLHFHLLGGEKLSGKMC